MGKQDITTKLLTRDNDVFAELFNTFFFKEDIVDPKKLIEQDTTELFAFAEKNGSTQSFRDVLKMAEVKTDDKFTYLLLGLENQADIHYAMVIRSMLYDAVNYSSQVSEIRKEIRNKNGKKYSNSEWLGGFPKDRKLMPVITLVICWNPEKWDAPKSLFDMLDPSIVKKYGKWINNYNLNLISVHDLPDELLQSTKTEIGLALEFSKYSNNKEKLQSYQNDERFKNRSNEFVATINSVTRSKFKLNQNGGRVDMCEGMRLLLEETAEKAAEKAAKEAAIKAEKAAKEAAIKAEAAVKKAKRETQDEAIKSFYQMCRTLHPEDSIPQTIKLIAKTFHRTQKAIRLLVL